MKLLLLLVCIACFLVPVFFWQRHVKLRREAFIRSFVLPKGLYEKLRLQHPDLTLKECQLVAQGLRQFFLAYLKSGKQYVAMPSQVVDDLWHELILYTKNYQRFCQQAFGSFLHHTPAVILSNVKQSNEGMRRCWRYACMEENIDPKAPKRLPLLFALDTKLKIANGFYYAADCTANKHQLDNNGITHCGGDFSSTGFDGGTDGLDFSFGGDGDGGDSDGGGCGGGCGGD